MSFIKTEHPKNKLHFKNVNDFVIIITEINLQEKTIHEWLYNVRQNILTQLM